MSLAFLLVLGGHAVRDYLLTDRDGRWRAELERLPWSQADSLAEGRTGSPSKPVLVLPLSINTAPRDSLVLLPGVGPVLARRILAARQRGEVFRRADDLMIVKGIGPRLASRLDTLLVFAAPAGAASQGPHAVYPAGPPN